MTPFLLQTVRPRGGKPPVRSVTFSADIFLADFNKHDVRADPDDAVPRNDVFEFSSEKPAETAGSGYDQGSDTAGLRINFEVAHTAERPAGADIDDILLTQDAVADGGRKRRKRFLHGGVSFLGEIFL